MSLQPVSKKHKKKPKWQKYWPAVFLIIICAILIYSIFNSYQKIYQAEIEINQNLTELNDTRIKRLYVEVEKVIEENGEKKIVKVLEKKRKKPEEREVKGIYLTAYGAITPSIYNRAIRLLEETELNAVIIDIKDYSGELSYDSNVPLVEEIGADASPKIKDMKKIIDELHAKDIYVIARQTIFQDPVLSKQKPEWAVQNKKTGRRWFDRKGLGWVDPTIEKVWDYNISIAKEAVRLGFDEINLDYIRFPTDGDIKAMRFKNLPGSKTKHEIIKDFIKYFSQKMKDEPAYISVDLFGLVTVKVREEDDLGIGQLLVDFVPYVDYISPMVYPSHYGANFNGYANPAEYPYEVVKYSMEKAKEAFSISPPDKDDLEGFATEPPQPLPNQVEDRLLSGGSLKPRAKLRPWLQDFDLGAVYDASMVKKQIQAAKEAGAYGWLLWNPRNVYTEEALEKVN